MSYQTYRIRQKTESGYDILHIETNTNMVLRPNASGDGFEPAKTVEESLKALETSMAGKLDKLPTGSDGDPAVGNLVAVGADGTIVDSTKKPADFAAATHGHVGDDVTITGGADKVVIGDSVGTLKGSEVTATELGHLKGVTGPVQTQLNNKIAKVADATEDAIATFDGTGAVKDSKKKLADLAAKSTTLSGYGITDAYTKDEVDGKISSVYKPSGSIAGNALVEDLLIAGNVGNVYNITTEFTTTDKFVEGTGTTYPAGTNVAVVDVGSGDEHDYKFDAMSGVYDFSGYAKKTDLPEKATAEMDGLMSKEDFIKLSGIAEGATKVEGAITDQESAGTDPSNGYIKIYTKDNSQGTLTKVYEHPSYAPGAGEAATQKLSFGDQFVAHKMKTMANGHVAAYTVVTYTLPTLPNIVDIQFAATSAQPKNQKTGDLWFEEIS